MKVKMKDGGIGEYVFTPRPNNPQLFDAKLVKMEISERIFNGPDCYPWRKTFAYWPVKTINNRYVWLQTVYKQRCWAVWGTGFHMEPTVEYATLIDLLGITDV